MTAGGPKHIVTFKYIVYGVCGGLILIYPQPDFIYLRGTTWYIAPCTLWAVGCEACVSRRTNVKQQLVAHNSRFRSNM